MRTCKSCRWYEPFCGAAMGAASTEQLLWTREARVKNGRKAMSKYKPGDIVTIKGTEFAVLDVEKGTAKDGKDKLFVLLKEPVGSEKFSDDGNDYRYSTLRKAVTKWLENYARELYDRLIYPREVSLLTMDGRADYGNRVFSAAPLSFDEYRRYSKFIVIRRVG